MENENKVAEEKVAEVVSATPVEEKTAEEKVADTASSTPVEDKQAEDVKETEKYEGKKCCKNKCCMKKLFKNKTYLAVAVLVILIAASAAYKYWPKPTDIGPKAVKAKVSEFLKGKIPDGIAISDAVKENGLYKITLKADAKLGGQEQPVYISVDGNKIFQGVIDINQTQPKQDDQQAQAPEKTTADTKADVPEVKLFVMSYCPFGTQMEKGILPVLQTLGSKIKFTLEFVDYSMHNSLASNDRKELDENLRQYCIQKNQPAKLQTYLGCFLDKGQGTENTCLAKAGINAAQITSCMSATDTQFNVTKDFQDKSSYQGQFPQFEVNKDENAKFGVQGSPTLVINGSQVSPSGRDSQSILKAICSGFNNAPAECNKTLSTTQPAPGFGSGAAAAGGSSASCATPQQ